MAGRPREFDTEAALENAIDVFWECGYDGASLTDLVAAMGVGRQSIYNAFGDKYGLFITALDHYVEQQQETLRPLAAADAGVEEIIEYLEQRVRDLTADWPRAGCLLVNSITELGALDEEVGQRARLYLRRLTRAFSAALRHAIAQGQIAPEIDPLEVAHHLANTAIGLAVMAKAGVSRRILRQAVGAATHALS